MSSKNRAAFAEEVRSLINRKSMEGEFGNTPDFILSEYVLHCLDTLSIAIDRRKTHQAPDLVVDVTKVEYTGAIGDAGMEYMQGLLASGTVCRLPATFRWSDLWDAMREAAGIPTTPQEGVAVMIDNGRRPRGRVFPCVENLSEYVVMVGLGHVLNVRVWRTCMTPDEAASCDNEDIRKVLASRAPNDWNKQTLAEALTEVTGVSAVQVSDSIEGAGVVIYTEWP